MRFALVDLSLFVVVAPILTSPRWAPAAEPMNESGPAVIVQQFWQKIRI
jgi:hypothetical protein